MGRLILTICGFELTGDMKELSTASCFTLVNKGVSRDNNFISKFGVNPNNFNGILESNEETVERAREAIENAKKALSKSSRVLIDAKKVIESNKKLQPYLDEVMLLSSKSLKDARELNEYFKNKEKLALKKRKN